MHSKVPLLYMNPLLHSSAVWEGVEVPHLLRGQQQAGVEVLLIQAVPLLVLDVGELAEMPLLLDQAWHKCNAGQLGPLAEFVPQICCAVNVVPELSCVLLTLAASESNPKAASA